MAPKSKALYLYGKAVYDEQVSKQGAVDTLISTYGMTRDAAENYLRVNRHLREKREMSQS